MNNIHILFSRNDEEAPEEMVKRLPNCPVCGAKAFLHGDAPDGFWMGWSIGCPRYCLNDGIHGHDFNTPRKDHFTRCGFSTKKSAIAWWKKRVKTENERAVKQMNCMSKKVRLHKEQMSYERKKVEEEKYLNSLTEEERIEYLKAQEKRGRQAMQLLAAMTAVSAGAYGALSGIIVDGDNKDNDG